VAQDLFILLDKTVVNIFFIFLAGIRMVGVSKKVVPTSKSAN
jgi:hypothetical protein